MPKTFILLYQGGIANLFESLASPDEDGYSQRRVFQGDYRGAELIARGTQLMGAWVKVMHANVAGDARLPGNAEKWEDGPGDLWRENKFPPQS